MVFEATVFKDKDFNYQISKFGLGGGENKERVLKAGESGWSYDYPNLISSIKIIS